MAYYLQFDGSNDRVTIQCQATSAESWSLEWQLFAVPTPDSFGFARIFGGSTPADATNRISTQIGGGDVSTRFANTTKTWSGKTFANTDKFRIEYNGAQLELFINDVSQGVIAGTVTASFGLLGCNSNFYTNIALMYATFTNITTTSKSRDYQPSLSGGAGSTLTDAANVVNGTLVNFPADNSQWAFYESGNPEPPSGTNYDAGGSSTMLMSSLGGASVNALAGGSSAMSMADAGGASVTVSAGGSSDSVMADYADATLTAKAGGTSVMTMTAQGGAEVGSEITGGGVSAMTMNATGGATVTAGAGGAYEFSFIASGSASVHASAGGVSQAEMLDVAGESLAAAAGGASVMVMSENGGAAVNEQAVKINRVALPSARLPTTMALPSVAMLQSVSINGQFNYRRTL